MADLRCRRVAAGPTLAVVAFLLLAALAASTRAASPIDIYKFDTPQQEARYRALVAELRCPKCLNTNLAGSDAPIAADLRRTVHRLITSEGMTDQQIRDYLQARYGDFVLYDPPFRPDTWVLWLTPALLVLLGAFVLWRMLRQPPGKPLSDDEAGRLRTILDQD